MHSDPRLRCAASDFGTLSGLDGLSDGAPAADAFVVYNEHEDLVAEAVEG